MNSKPLITGVAAAVLIILTSVGLKVAEHAHLVAPLDTVQSFQVIMGLLIAVYGNFIPKRVVALRNPDSAGRMQAAQRVSGWSMTLAGLAYAGLSAFVPTPTGNLLAMAAVAAAVVITLVYAAACAAGAARASKGSAG